MAKLDKMSTDLMLKLERNEAVVCIIGMGYVGLPLAQAFSKSLKVIGFDIDTNKVKKLNRGNSIPNVILTDDPGQIGEADFIVICVPTPVTKSKEPDLSYIISAAKLIGENMTTGSIVILESTVYPGVTEEIVKPILEKESGLKCGCDFRIAYSPERITPGDEEHTIDRITKVVAGMDEATTEVTAEFYRKVAPNIFKAKDIKTAEAAKVIENIQRDLNIALVNELALIFDKMGLSTRDVLETAATKWNFNEYYPGLVGGHCIPIDPYYLVHKAKELGYHPQVILAGRAINDYIPQHVAHMAIKALNSVGKVIKDSRVLIMGLTFKENVPDTRQTLIKEAIKELNEYRVEIFGYDPWVDDIQEEFGIKTVQIFEDIKDIDCVILATAHNIFQGITLDKLKTIMSRSPILIDVRGIFNKEEAETRGFYYKSL